MGNPLVAIGLDSTGRDAKDQTHEELLLVKPL